MNVVMVGPFGMWPKSTMRVRALPIAQSLVKRGHRVTMLLPPWSNPHDAGTTANFGDVRVVNLRLPPRIPGVFHLLLTVALVRSVLALQPSVVYCFKPKAYAGSTAWCLWQLRRLGIHHSRLVVDTDDWEGAGGWNAVEPYVPLYKHFFAWQEKWGLTHADAITVASRALQTLAWSLGVPRGAVHYTPNGVDAFATMAESQSAQRTSTPTALLYTRFFEFDLERIAHLMVSLSQAIPALKLVIVGKGFFGEEIRFAQILSSAGLSDRVASMGWPPADGLQTIFARTTVALFPFDDTLLNRTKCSVKLTELLTAGMPVVAEAVGQNAEYIVHGQSGLLAAPGDEQCFIEAVRSIVCDDGLRGRLSNGARARMRERYSWERIVGEVEAALTA
jgi:glycosyltransferase involved in cell wall biosynthesis